jgi:membrane protein required for colicin V production
MVLDVLIVFIMIIFVFKGLRSGLIMSITSLFGIFISAILASKHLNFLYSKVIEISSLDLPRNVNDNYYIYIAFYLLFLLVFYLIIYYSACIIRSIFGLLMLGWIDKILGAIFGFLKGFIVCFFIFGGMRFLSKINSSAKFVVDRSEIVKKFPDLSEWLINILPEDIRNDMYTNFYSYLEILKRFGAKDDI